MRRFRLTTQRLTARSHLSLKAQGIVPLTNSTMLLQKSLRITTSQSCFKTPLLFTIKQNRQATSVSMPPQETLFPTKRETDSSCQSMTRKTKSDTFETIPKRWTHLIKVLLVQAMILLITRYTKLPSI